MSDDNYAVTVVTGLLIAAIVGVLLGLILCFVKLGIETGLAILCMVGLSFGIGALFGLSMGD